MADLNFPQNPYVGQTYSIGTRTWIWNGSGWALQSGILSTNPFRVISAEITTSTNSTGTNSGALIVAGGAGFGGDVWANRIFAQGAEVVTTASIGNFGVSSITAGTDTSVYLGLGNVALIWNTSTLQTVTSRGATTNNAISITNGTASSASNTGSLTLSGGAGIAGNLYVGGGTLGLDNGTSNTISFGSVGTGAPTFTTRSAGTKLLLYPAISGSQVDYAVGIDSATLWSSVPVNSNSFSFKWFGGTTEVASISGTGVFSATSVYDNTNRVLTSVTPVAGTAISISAVSTSGPNTTFTVNNIGVTSLVGTSALGVGQSTGDITLTNLGVTSATGSTYLGVSASTGSVTFTNLGVQTLTAGTDTAVSQSTGTVTVWNTSTLQTVTGRGAVTTNAIQISNATASTTSTDGALTVTGGVGIGNNLNVAGTLNVFGRATFSSPVTFSGTATFVHSTNTYYTDNLLELHVPLSGVNGEWAADDGKDIGLRFHYYNRTLATGTNAALVLSDDTQWLEFYSTGAESIGGVFTGTTAYGGFKVGDIKIVNTSSNTANAVSGALQVSGGVGINGTQFIAGVGGVPSFIAIDRQSLIVNSNGIGVFGESYFASEVGFGNIVAITGNATVGGNLGVTGLSTLSSLVVTNASIFNGSVTANSTLGVRGNLNVTGTSLLSTVNASSLGVSGNFNVTGTSLLSGITTIGNTTDSASTDSGALIVNGGLGVNKNVTIGGDIFVAGVINATVVGSISTATNLAGGATGAIPYQTAFGRTSFINPGAAGTVLVSNGIGAQPNYQNTLTLAGNANATNTTSGALQVAGGVGIGRDLWVGGNVYTLGQQVITTATVNNYANQTFLFAGTDTAVSTSSGNITVWNISTLQSVTNRGASTTNALSIINATQSTGTASGALTVEGGIGIGGNLTVGGSLTVGTNSFGGSTGTFSYLNITGAGTALAVTNNATFGGNITATTVNVTSQSILQNVNAAITTVTTLTVTGDETVTGNLGVQGTLNVTGTTVLSSAYLSNDLGVQGNFNTTGTSKLVGAVYAGSNVGIQGNLAVTGTSVLTGATTVNGNLGVAANLNVTGTTVLSSNLTVNSNLTVTNTLNVGSTTTFAKSIIVGPASQYKSYVSATTSTTDVLVIDTFDSTFYRTVKYLVQVVDTGYTPNLVQVEEFLVFHDNNGASTTVEIIQYAVGSNMGSLGEFDATYSSGEITIQFTPAITPTSLTVKTVRTAVTV